MTDPKAELDQCAADLVSASRKLDSLAAFVRWEGSEVRIIAPADFYPQLARMFYSAADLCALQCPTVKYDPPPR